MGFGIPEIIASASAVGAFSAVFVAWNQGRLTHKHNVLSVKPLLELSLKFDLSGYVAKVENKGLGPAIINSVIVKVDGNTQAMDEALDLKIDKALRACLHESVGRITSIKSIDYKNQKVIKNDKDFTLFDLQFVRGTHPNCEITIKRIQGMTIEIEYSDLYGNAQKPLMFENLGWSSWSYTGD
jgi:hypothetical protein